MPVTVALPTRAWNPGFPRAFASIASQTYGDLDILVVLNGVAPGDRARILDVVRTDRRARILELPSCGLAAALNIAFEAAHHELVARMDDDDESLPTRIGDQVAFMARNPRVAALGGAWEVIEPDGHPRCTVRPATHPAELRWRLLLGNGLAHGSMMLRRSAARWFGGYDTRLDKAQDYDLWLRIARVPGAIAALPNVIYRHFLRDGAGGWCTSESQARVTAGLMLREWGGLCRMAGNPAGVPWVEAGLARMLVSPRGEGRSGLDGALRAAGPTPEGLMAWLWGAWMSPPGERAAAEVCRRARVREVGARLRRKGVREVWLWGAGEHTRRMLAHADDLGLPIAGVVDDGRAGEEAFGFRVLRPEDLVPGAAPLPEPVLVSEPALTPESALAHRNELRPAGPATHAGCGTHRSAPDAPRGGGIEEVRGEVTVLISSDAHEEAIWARSAPLRARGVRVVRMYGEEEARE
ncbi:MAG: glycosyltransferase [Phycisphaerales bacterium]|nr:glycosyltransferase [Phycisphaerales bacterium]